MSLNLPKKILEVQTEALKLENLSAEDVGVTVYPVTQFSCQLDNTLPSHPYLSKLLQLLSLESLMIIPTEKSKKQGDFEEYKSKPATEVQ
nr:hypothetical protein [Tanacetum cinerariifolium]